MYFNGVQVSLLSIPGPSMHLNGVPLTPVGFTGPVSRVLVSSSVYRDLL